MSQLILPLFSFFFFNDTATTEIYTLSLHDALPICRPWRYFCCTAAALCCRTPAGRSEEHTSELQSPVHLVCRLLLEKKKQTSHYPLCVKNKISLVHRMVEDLNG